DSLAIGRNDYSHRDQCELIRGAVADLAIALAPGGRRRQNHGSNHFSRLQHSFDVRRAPWTAVEIIDCYAASGLVRCRSSICASNAAIATAMSEGCVAMQASLAPRIACMRLTP